MSHHHDQDHRYQDHHEHGSFAARPEEGLHRFIRENRHKSKLLKFALIAFAIITLLIIAFVVGLIMLFIHFLSIPSTSILQALGEVWQSVLDLLKPIAGLYNQAMDLVPGSQKQ